MRLSPEQKSMINSLWDKFWSGGLSNPLTSIEQMSYLIFMKRLEDMDNLENKRANLTGLEYHSVFPGEGKLRWSEWKHLPAEQMLVHVRDTVFPFIKNVHDGEKTLFSEHMKDAAFLIPKASLLKEAVAVLDDLNITGQSQDIQGDIYEYLLSQLKTAGRNGQFRTPRHIIRMMVKLVNPDIGDLICDPACGTGGFLFTAYNHIVWKHTSQDMVEEDEEGDFHHLIGDKITDKRHWDHLRNDSLFGYDFESTMVRIGLMNCVLHGITGANIERLDTLSKQYNEEKKYTVVLANPPFKGSIDKDDINEMLSLKTTKTELLFVERMVKLLQIGGRCAVIVPDGVLFGSSKAHKALRKILLESCQLEGIISMPSGVFKPYAGVSTAVLIFTKGNKTKRVWFYDMTSDGFSLDDKRNPIDYKGDIPDIIERFEKRGEEEPGDRKGKCFFVPVEEIIENDYDLSISKYKEIVYEEVHYDPPKVILDKIEKIQEEIAGNLKDLRGLLDQ